MSENQRSQRFPILAEVLTGETADVYFLRAREVLSSVRKDPRVGIQIFSSGAGQCCGILQVVQILQDSQFEGELWSLDEGDSMGARETVMEIFCPYSQFGFLETAILGVLASCSGWCTAARRVVDAAQGIPVVSFGARHLHPNVAGIMDYASVVGGCVTCSTPLGAALAGTEPSGTMPHALILVMGDTVEAAIRFDEVISPDVPRIVLVDTFQDEVVESIRVASELGHVLEGVRLDTPSERGGVTPALVVELRAKLDGAGFNWVQIVVSGGISPDRIALFAEANAPVNSYGVGSYISATAPIDFTADIREIEGTPVAKRGRIPGMQRNSRLRRLL